MDKQKLLEQELALEAEYKQMGVDALKKTLLQVDEGKLTELPLGKNLMRTEYTELMDEIKTFVVDAIKPKRGVQAAHVSFLKDAISLLYEDNMESFIGAMTLSAYSVALNNAMRGGHGDTFSTMAITVGHEVHMQVKYDYFMMSTKQTGFEGRINKRISEWNKRYFLENAMSKQGIHLPISVNKKALQSLGAWLLTIVINKSALFDSEAFNEDVNMVAPSQTLIEAYDRNTSYMLKHVAKYPPMIVPPKPWTDYWNGGYYGVLATGKLLRTHNNSNDFAKKYLRKLSQLNLDTVTDAVNAIQSTPWKINRDVLAVADLIMINGGGKAGLPYTDLPPKPMVLPAEPTKEQVKAYCKVMVRYYQSEAVRKSHALRARAIIETARRFKDYDKIYFPCNMDFRGRVYPISTFNFQGDDLTKGLIEFAEPKPLTKADNLKWFYVAGANHAGVDKVSYDDRVQWVKDNHDAIMGSADDSIGCNFWMEQDEPFQFLAWSMEYKKLMEYMDTHNGSPIGFTTGTVIAYDGTCSGLQHFSALLRDPIGGTAVNLVPQDKPNDIYRIVADKVNKVLEHDARDGGDDVKDDAGKIKYGTKTLSLVWLTYGVTRKVTKRCVMTLAYGSKRYGFADQILEDTIKPDMMTNGDKSVFSLSARQCSLYLSQLIWDAVRTTVVKAVEGMEWLQKCARMCTAKGDHVVSWFTPAGLLVQQHYTAKETVCYKLLCAGKLIRLYDYNTTDEVDKRHQASGIAPNFIHSLDAAHLQLTIDACVSKGLNKYATVHDSYGTELEDADVLFDTVREKFIQMYEDNDVLGELKKHLQMLCDDELPEPPAKGTLDLQVVKDSEYIFC